MAEAAADRVLGGAGEALDLGPQPAVGVPHVRVDDVALAGAQLQVLHAALPAGEAGGRVGAGLRVGDAGVDRGLALGHGSAVWASLSARRG
jgi:hypothetical protein